MINDDTIVQLGGQMLWPTVLAIHLCSTLSCEVDETDCNALSVECVNRPRSRLVTAPAAAECFRMLPSSAEVDDVLWTARHRHRAVARLRRH